MKKAKAQSGYRQIAAFGSFDNKNFAVKIKGLDNQDFFVKKFGHQLADLRRIIEWKKTAEEGNVEAKGKPTKKMVKAWIKENKPSEYYASWSQDRIHYKEDGVLIYYKA